jgi:3-carboxy-cis,cis-muconate cycloisomerase
LLKASPSHAPTPQFPLALSLQDAPGLTDALFTTEAMRALFSDRNRVQAMLDFEAALALAEAQAGVIPAPAAPAIKAQCRADLFDISALSRATADAGNPAIPLVKALTSLVARHDSEAARYVHWGATSQDAMDTGLVLQLRAALDVVSGDLATLSAALAALAQAHAHTPIAGRTWLQQATPVTLGLKAAGALSAIERHRARIDALRPRVAVLQFGGATGTLASLGEQGLAVAATLAKELDLALPDVPWHAHRDRIVEVATTLGLLVGTLGKIARDVSLLMQTEVGEAFEPAAAGRGGSSTMPHKRNPVSSAVVLAAAQRVPGLVSTMLSAMVQEHERGLGGWHAEWETLPALCTLTAGALAHSISTMQGLEVDGQRMAANLKLTGGLVLAEAVAMALATHLGKEAAHELVESACRRSIDGHRPLLAVLDGDASVRAHLSTRDLERLLDPRNYTGSASALVDRALSAYSTRGIAASGPPGLPPSDGFSEVDGARLHYRIDGAERAPVLVLSNSLGTDLAMWEPQIPALLRAFRVLRYDTRGHGTSADAPGPYSIERLGRDVVGLLDSLGIERAHFCGLSMGGMIGMWLGVHAPGRLHRLVLANTAARIGIPDNWNARIDKVRAGGMAAISQAVVERWFTPGYIAEHPDRIVAMRQMLERTPAQGYVACCAAVRDMDQRDAVAAIGAPTLVIAGTHDVATPVADGRFLADRIEGAAYAEIDAAHLSNIEAAPAFTTALLAFLNA